MVHSYHEARSRYLTPFNLNCVYIFADSVPTTWRTQSSSIIMFVHSRVLVKHKMLYVSAAYAGPRVNPVLCCVFLAYGLTPYGIRQDFAQANNQNQKSEAKKAQENKKHSMHRTHNTSIDESFRVTILVGGTSAEFNYYRFKDGMYLFYIRCQFVRRSKHYPSQL
jgi:hypothetical protein